MRISSVTCASNSLTVHINPRSSSLRSARGCLCINALVPVIEIGHLREEIIRLKPWVKAVRSLGCTCESDMVVVVGDRIPFHQHPMGWFEVIAVPPPV